MHANCTLGELITHLENLPETMVVKEGFLGPHSYRGYYEHLAFEPAENVQVRDMLADARYALGQTFHGWKGGEYLMIENTPCWLANDGECGVPMVSPYNKHAAYLLPTAEDGV